jgi:hypothetical protein
MVAKDLGGHSVGGGGCLVVSSRSQIGN